MKTDQLVTAPIIPPQPERPLPLGGAGGSAPFRTGAVGTAAFGAGVTAQQVNTHAGTFTTTLTPNVLPTLPGTAEHYQYGINASPHEKVIPSIAGDFLPNPLDEVYGTADSAGPSSVRQDSDTTSNEKASAKPRKHTDYTDQKLDKAGRIERLSQLRAFKALNHLWTAGTEALKSGNYSALVGKLVRYAPMLIRIVAKESPWGAAASSIISNIDPNGAKMKEWTEKGTAIAKDAIEHIRKPSEERDAKHAEGIKERTKALVKDVASEMATLDNAIAIALHIQKKRKASVGYAYEG
jgi:hypothetical protein